MGVPCACGQIPASACALGAQGAATPRPQDVRACVEDGGADSSGKFLVFISTVHLRLFIYLFVLTRKTNT